MLRFMPTFVKYTFVESRLSFLYIKTKNPLIQNQPPAHVPNPYFSSSSSWGAQLCYDYKQNLEYSY